MNEPCVFCDRVLMGLDRSPVDYHYDNTIASFRDAYPSTPGHTLIIPVRHVARVADLTRDEWACLFTVARSHINCAAGYIIGINDGEPAGQTVPHVHLHVIPRAFGDTADPRGGIRWAIPETADYWTAGKSRA